ncbi:HAD family phosphatase [Nitrosopumilus sp. K4]|uniref:HAD family hydrolase n=1 Tax=Nitrosopumilus sp. K4 TaxID=2795383 RepID=UPI001BA7F933|nr:HAD family phosphatase [Nitrosopumilus sp. K4]QUC64953.1 HAD family phosphatase [Nitrosopumilus sp. K4]
MSEIKCILFDIGGVLVDWHMSWITSEVSKRFKIKESLINEGFTNYLHELDSGYIDENTFWRKIADYIGSESLRNNTESLWSTYFSKNAKPNHSIINIAKDLQTNSYTMGIISNIEKITHKIVNDWNVLEPFEHYFMSYQIGFSKPNPKIYEHVLERLPFKPNEVFFIDDKQSNVDAARKFGLKSVLFEDDVLLKKSLDEYGIKV